MKYNLFTEIDPSKSNKIGTADAINFLPVINQQGQLCWESRPGWTNLPDVDGIVVFDVVDVPTWTECAYDGTIMQNLPPPKNVWDTVDNVNVVYVCFPEDNYREYSMVTYFSAGSKKTCYYTIRINFVDVYSTPLYEGTGGFGWTLYFWILNGSADWPDYTPYPDYPVGYAPPQTDVMHYVNIPADATQLVFETGDWPGVGGPVARGGVTITCIMIKERDWDAAGEDLNHVYDENGDIFI